jgi:ABC-type polysaccharide/polyol phosphate export permease
MTKALQDLRAGLFHWRLWTMIAIDDWRVRFHRTLLGPLWIIIAFLLFIGVKILIFSNMSGTNAKYFSAYLTLGFMIWMFINQSMQEGSSAFLRARNWILGIHAPFSNFLFSTVLICIVNAAFTALPALIISYIVHPFTLMDALQAFGAFIFVAFSMFWVQLFLATASVFFRDLVQLVSTVMRVMFFLTPILWLPSQLGSVASVVKYNPFTYYLNIIRDYLLEGHTSALNWMVVGAITCVSMVLSLILFAAAHKRIPSYI